MEHEWDMARDDVHKYGGRGGMSYGYQDIQKP